MEIFEDDYRKLEAVKLAALSTAERSAHASRVAVQEWLEAIEKLNALTDTLAALGFPREGLSLAEIAQLLKDNPPKDELQRIQNR